MEAGDLPYISPISPVHLVGDRVEQVRRGEAQLRMSPRELRQALG